MFSNKRIMALFSLTLVIALSLFIPPLIAENSNHFGDADPLPLPESILDETYLASNQFTQPDDLTAVGDRKSVV